MPEVKSRPLPNPLVAPFPSQATPYQSTLTAIHLAASLALATRDPAKRRRLLLAISAHAASALK